MSLPSQVADWNFTHGNDDDDDEWWAEAGAETWDHTNEGRNGYGSGSSAGTGSVSSGGGGGGGDENGDENAGGSTATTSEEGHGQKTNNIASSSWAGEKASMQKRAVSMPNPIIDSDIVGVGTEEGAGAAHNATTAGDPGYADVLGDADAHYDNGSNTGGGCTSQSESKLLHVSLDTMQPLEALMVRCWAEDPLARPSMGKRLDPKIKYIDNSNGDAGVEAKDRVGTHEKRTSLTVIVWHVQ
jgi:hypothetical protein